jgi:MFS family permease
MERGNGREEWTEKRTSSLTRNVPLRSAINGILAMDTFKHDFTTGYNDESGRPGMYPNQVALIVAMLSAGCTVGALLSAPIGDYWGRRPSLIFAIAVFCVGGIFQVCANSVPLLVIGRYVLVLDLFFHPNRSSLRVCVASVPRFVLLFPSPRGGFR